MCLIRSTEVSRNSSISNPVLTDYVATRWYYQHFQHLQEREVFTDNLLVRIHLIIEVISVDRTGNHSKGFKVLCIAWPLTPDPAGAR